MKKVAIIGAGIAGLTCGIYARINGFDTEIYELHTIPGGECTGWDRGDYYFDGCIHWLVGSRPGTSLHQLWRDTGALDDSVRIIQHDIFARYEEEGAAVNLYTNADALEKHLLEIAPEDRKPIRKLCKDLRKMGDIGFPLDKPIDKMTASDGIKMALKNRSGMAGIMRYGSMTMKQLVQSFQNPLLKRAFTSAFSEDNSAMAFVTTLAGMNAGDCGFPAGGSRALAQRMEKRYKDLGGKVFYQSRIEKILVENGKAVGIQKSDGTVIRADYIVSCGDGYDTLYRLLEDRYTPEVYRNLFAHPEQYPTPTSALVFVGVDAEIPYDFRSVAVRRKESGTMGGSVGQILHYGFDDSLQPKGKTVLAFYYEADYDYWNKLYQDKEKYREEKKKLEQDALNELTRRFPQAEGKIQVTDVVTPITYARYCNAWRGSWMTWLNRAKGVPQYFPGILPGLENFLMAGMWTLPPGGLPGASASGRFAAHRLCMWEGIAFNTDHNPVETS